MKFFAVNLTLSVPLPSCHKRLSSSTGEMAGYSASGNKSNSVFINTVHLIRDRPCLTSWTPSDKFSFDNLRSTKSTPSHHIPPSSDCHASTSTHKVLCHLFFALPNRHQSKRGVSYEVWPTLSRFTRRVGYRAKFDRCFSPQRTPLQQERLCRQHQI
jgi:hypothetical protein